MEDVKEHAPLVAEVSKLREARVEEGVDFFRNFGSQDVLRTIGRKFSSRVQVVQT